MPNRPQNENISKSAKYKAAGDAFRARGRATNSMLFCDNARARELARTGAVNGRSWWECDRAELNRRAQERFPHHEGRYREPNF